MFNFLNRKGIFRRYILPKTLYGRFIILIIVPVLMVQIFTLWVFYDRHWQHTTRHMSISIIRDVNAIVQRYKVDPVLAEKLSKDLSMHLTHYTEPVESNLEPYNDLTGQFFIKQYNNQAIGNYGAIIRFISPSSVRLVLSNNTERFVFIFDEYRLYSNTTANLVWYWTISIGVIFSMIALAVARNQARPIKQLSRSLIAFSQGDSTGVDTISIRGSNEIRSAIYNFKIMAKRIMRQRQQRTNMLSGISHDLRTPLTRMKLLLAMMEGKETKNLKDNILDMERLIDAYLSFAKGEKEQVPQLVHLHSELKIISKKWQDAGHNVSFKCTHKVSSKLRLVSIQRMLENIITNAVKYGDTVNILLKRHDDKAVITILDNGCGIPEDKLSEVFNPFTRVDESRNIKTGGVGLGLAVSMDIATVHGGTITLENRTDTCGLKAEIILPISMDA